MIDYNTSNDFITIGTYRGLLKLRHVYLQDESYRSWSIHSNSKLEFVITITPLSLFEHQLLKQRLVRIMIRSKIFNYKLSRSTRIFKLNDSELLKLI